MFFMDANKRSHQKGIFSYQGFGRYEVERKYVYDKMMRERILQVK
jgi:hypothetical protein